jgi:hypothetical protein
MGKHCLYKILREANPRDAGEGCSAQRVKHLVVQLQDATRVSDGDLALLGQKHFSRLTTKQRNAYFFVQAFHLEADCGWSSAEPGAFRRNPRPPRGDRTAGRLTRPPRAQLLKTRFVYPRRPQTALLGSGIDCRHRGHSSCRRGEYPGRRCPWGHSGCPRSRTCG